MKDARTGVGVTALLCALALAGCTTPDPVVAPPPSPAPTSATPTETAAERQERLDYAAAEKAYRTFRAEYNRVLRAGGAKEPTKVMKETAGGDYLATFTAAIKAYRANGTRDVGIEKILDVRPDGYSANMVTLSVCEDSRAVRTIDSSGASGAGELRTALLQVRKVSGKWKLWSGSGKKVTECD